MSKIKATCFLVSTIGYIIAFVSAWYMISGYVGMIVADIWTKLWNID